MTSSPALSGYYPKSYDWTQSHEHREGHDSLDRSSPSKDPASSPSTRRSGPGSQRLSFSPSPLVMSNQPNTEYIKTNPKSAAPIEPYVRDSSEDNYNNLRRAGNRWSFNGAEKTIDSKLSTWDLVDEIGKLSIANGSTGEGTDGTTTPSKNGVLQIHEASPLETSSSDTSLDSASPQNPDTLNLPSHSRGSSTDTLNSETSAPSNAAHLNSLKAAVVMSDLTKDRPRSFSGALSDVELRRLQNINTPSQLPDSLQDRGSPLTREVSGGENKPPSSVPSGENIGGSVQPMYPSITSYPTVQQQQVSQFVNSNTPALHQGDIAGRRQEDLQQRQQFNANNQGLGPNSFLPVQTNGIRNGQPDVMPQYRQQIRGINMFQPPVQMQAQAPPPLLPSPTNFGYPPGMANAPGHQNAMSLGTSQQMYNMLLPMDPGMNRTQQVFRAGHQHSASDPASLRDAAAILLGAGVHNMQGMQFSPTPAMSPGMYPPMAMTPPVFSNQFFPPGTGPQPQDMYSQDMMNAMAQQIPQFTGSTGVPSTPQANTSSFAGSPSPPNSSGPSANNRKLGLYKTELCRSWEEKGSCRYGPKCQFAHGEEEIRKVARHPKYKTEICRTFWVSGSCPYGKRCCFIHTELPASGTPPGAVEGAAVPPPTHDGRARSMSTNSDPNDAQNSLLARITAKRKVEENGATTPTVATMENGNGTGYQYAHKPPTGALRVDTNVEAPVASKQNKSAYPTFASSSMQALSPGPVTAGPEFGHRIGSSGVGITDSINQRMAGSGPNPNSRHSYTASEASITFGQQARNVSGGSTPFSVLSGQTDSPAPSKTPSGHGHSRSGSASNWGSFSQKSTHLGTGSSPYAHTPSPGNDPMTAGAVSVVLPWANDLNTNTRHNDRTWS